MEFLLLATSIVFGTARNLAAKIGKDVFATRFAAHLLNVIVSVVAAGMYSLANDGFSPAQPLLVWLLAFFFAGATILAQIAALRAALYGSVSASALFYSSGFIIPALSGAFFYHEKITVTQVAGVITLFVAFFLNSDGADTRKLNARWLFFAVVSMVSSGLVGVAQKIFRMSEYKDRSDDFLIISFLLVFVYSVVACVFTRREAAGISGRIGKYATAALVTAVCVAVCNKINLWLSGVLPSMMMFPFVNGGYIVMSSLAAGIFLKERLSSRHRLAIVIGLAGIVLISIKPA